MNQDLDIRKAIPEMETQIADLFRTLKEAREGDFFQPHPFTPEEASRVANYQGKDFYALAFHNGASSGNLGLGVNAACQRGLFYKMPGFWVQVFIDIR